jgi:hypothetical protein
MEKAETICIILHNKHDYNTNFQNKDTWEKNLKRFVHDFLETHKESQIYKKYILVPKYLIDAPFEIPNVNTASYVEEEYCIKNGISDESDDYIEDVNHYTVSTKLFSKYNSDCNNDADEDTDEDTDESDEEDTDESDEEDTDESDEEDTDESDEEDTEQSEEDMEQESSIISCPSNICVGIILSVYFATALSMVIACTFSNDNKIIHTEF